MKAVLSHPFKVVRREVLAVFKGFCNLCSVVVEVVTCERFSFSLVIQSKILPCFDRLRCYRGKHRTISIAFLTCFVLMAPWQADVN